MDQGFESLSEVTQYIAVHRCIREGLGAHLNNCTVSGVWQQSERDLHINILELKSVFLVLKHFKKQGKKSCYFLQTTQLWVLISTMKGILTTSKYVLWHWRILTKSNSRQIHIRARHIPGNLNVIADSLSRRDNKAIQPE